MLTVILLFIFTPPINNVTVQMRDQTEARLKELEHVHDLRNSVERKLQKCQESLLSCQKSCVDKSKAFRELQFQVLVKQ